MDCNKEEAIRAKAIAEKKMETKDFFGAKKVAQKAQQLYPDLENISQMIVVCDVHCSSQNTVYGNEKDWYAILKVEPTADELSIKKQYRKLALLLHPDKNKFAGSDDAFKLIGEAQRVLLDREKRLLHDSKRKATGRSAAPNWVPRQPSRHPNIGQQAWTRTTFTPVNTQAPPQRPETGLNEKRATFWTACPFCSVRYQFYRDVINKLLSCQSCKRSFTGYEMNAQGVAAPATNWPPPQVPVNGGPQGTSLNPASNAGVKGKTVGENSRKSFAKTQFYSEVREGSKPKEGQPNERKSYGKANGRRRKQVEESSESCDSGSSTDLEDDEVIKEDPGHPTPQDFQYYSEQPRRSSRSKRSVSYSEKNLNDDDDDDDVKPSKKAKREAEYPSQKEEKSPDGRELKQEKQHYAAGSQNGERETQKEDEKETPAKMEAETETGTEAEPEIYECPDPDFSDFDKDKKEEVFDVGQMWAVYDTQDAMPRFYARIRKVSPNFKLQITWLEPDPDGEDDVNWVNADLPVSCGKFKRGNADKAEDHPMFSHLVNWEKGSKRDTFKIYPGKGQTWALYKNWDTLRKWSSSNPEVRSDERIKYEYEFAEILTNYDEGVGISIAYLGKVKGFACLFHRKAEQEGGGMVSLVTIPPNELYRFSHRVPSFQMTGEEREGVPKGSFELDPAALPPNLEV